jgi:hypothetical protein
MWSQISKVFNVAVIIALVFQLSGCGTILHPERKGQKSGRLDIGIVVLDTIGLLFFLIPGIIAFAVDFSNGTIYLPGGHSSLKQIKFDPKRTTLTQVEQMIQKETGRSVKLTQSNIQVTRINTKDELVSSFAMSDLDNNRLASAR